MNQNSIEKWIESAKKHQKTILYSLVAIVAVIGGVYYLINHFLPEREKQAQADLAMAQFEFEKGQFEKALKGAGKQKGFEYVIDNYSFTKASKIAKYYAGVSYLNLGQVDKAISKLEDFSTDVSEIQALCYMNLGHCYAEKNKMEDALNYYNKAAKATTNAVLGPKIAMIAVKAYINCKKPQEAEEMIDYMDQNFPNSHEAQVAQVLRAAADAQKK